MLEVKLQREVTKTNGRNDFQIANLSSLKEIVGGIPGHAALKGNGTLKS